MAAVHSLLINEIYSSRRLLYHGLIRFGKPLDCYKDFLRCENLESIWIAMKL
jgi:hypothetical protein